MRSDTMREVNARCFGRDEKTRDKVKALETLVGLNSVKAFIEAVVDTDAPDFVCSC